MHDVRVLLGGVSQTSTPCVLYIRIKNAGHFTLDLPEAFCILIKPIMKRIARESDIAQVFAIYMDATVNPFLGYDPMAMDEFLPVYAQLMSKQAFFVYELAGEVAGFYCSNRYPGRASHVAYIGTFAVAPKYHGQGVARKMLESEISALRDQGVLRIEVIVESDNVKAKRFYAKLGFEVEGTLRKFYKRSTESNYIDDHIMALVFEKV